MTYPHSLHLAIRELIETCQSCDTRPRGPNGRIFVCAYHEGFDDAAVIFAPEHRP
jgi:hypothetical protein